MFQNKTPVAVLAGMAVAGSILMAPGVVAAPTGATPWPGAVTAPGSWGTTAPLFECAGGGGHLRGAGRQDGHRDQRWQMAFVCSGRWSGLLLGHQPLREARQQQHHLLEGAGRGGHLRGAGR